MKLLTRCALTLAYAWSAVVLGAAGSGSSTGDISKVDSSVRVEAGQQAGDVSTVNGSLTLRHGVRVGGGLENVSRATRRREVSRRRLRAAQAEQAPRRRARSAGCP